MRVFLAERTSGRLRERSARLLNIKSGRPYCSDMGEGQWRLDTLSESVQV